MASTETLRCIKRSQVSNQPLPFEPAHNIRHLRKIALEVKKPLQDMFMFWESRPSATRVFSSSFHDLMCLLCPSSLFKVFCEETGITIGTRGDFLKYPLLELSLRLFSWSGIGEIFVPNCSLAIAAMPQTSVRLAGETQNDLSYSSSCWPTLS